MDLRDVHALVPDPLEVEVDVQDRGEEAKIARHRRLDRDQLEHAAVDVEVAFVDRVVFADYRFRELGIVVDDRSHATSHRALGELALLEDLQPEILHGLVELRSRLGHQPNRPVT